jgi:signal transduction histidine kinase
VKPRLTNWLNSLTAKYVAVFVLLVAVPAIGITVYLLNSSYNDNKAALIRLQQEKADALAGKVEDFLAATVARLGSVHLDGLPFEEADAVLCAMNRARVEPNGLAFYLDFRGRGVAACNIGIEDLSARPEFTTALRKGSYMSDVATDQGQSSTVGLGPGFMYITAAENSGRGVVGTALDAAGKFQELIGGARFGRSGYAYAVTGEGDLIVYPSLPVRRLSAFGKLDFNSLPQVKEAHASHDLAGSSTGRTVGGTKVLAAWATVHSTGWKVFVEQPESAAFAPLRGKIWGTALIIAAFVLAAVALSILLARRLVRPIKRLQVAAEAIGAGAYDERIELERKDELGALASAFNQMAAHLQELIGGLERKVAERTRALEVASKHKSEFLANMSHELRTPLNAIIGFTQVLQQKLFGDVNEKQEEYLEDVNSSADHLLALINDILDLSKVEAGQVELEVERFSLRDALERGMVMIRERATKNGVALELELDPQVDLVEGDERRIRQVVFNLLSNAVKFTPQGGRVDVSALQENGEVMVAVTDTGPGIAPEDQGRIFEEFQQARDTNGERPEGTGLGLALSRSLVELHGGRIWVESAPGKGSTFSFTIPVGSAS